jgi:hypothetical protein
MVKNLYIIPELENNIQFGTYGVLPEDADILISVAERIFNLRSMEVLLDRELDKRTDHAFLNWQDNL